MSNIRLFPADWADNFTITSENNDSIFSGLGVGKITDCLSCTVTEERNGEFELEMEYPVTGIRYSDLGIRMIIVAPPNPYDAPQPFRIYSITKAYDGVVTVHAQHISYDLSDSVVKSASVENDNLNPANIYSTAKSAALIPSKFFFSTDLTVDDSMEDSEGKKLTKWVLKGPKSLKNILLGSGEDSILTNYVGETDTGEEPEFKFNNFSIQLLKKRGENRNVTIRYGKNMTSFSQEETLEKIYTHVYPFYYASSLTYYEGGYGNGAEHTVEDFALDLSAYEGSSYVSFPFIDTGLRDVNGNPFAFKHILPLDTSSLYYGDYEVKIEDPNGVVKYTTKSDGADYIELFYEGYFDEDLEDVEGWGDALMDEHYSTRKKSNKTVGRDETIMACFTTDYWFWDKGHNTVITQYPDIQDIHKAIYESSHYTFRFGDVDLKGEIFRIRIFKNSYIDGTTGKTVYYNTFKFAVKVSRESEPETGGDWTLVYKDYETTYEHSTRAVSEGDESNDSEQSYYIDIYNSEDLKRVATSIEKAAMRYIKENRLMCFPVNLSIGFDDTEKPHVQGLRDIRLCDTVTVYYPMYNVMTAAKCTKTEYDCMKEKYKSVEFSNSYSNLAFTTAKSIEALRVRNTANNRIFPSLSYLKFSSLLK